MKRFWERVDKSGDCWNWLGHTRGGYGRIRVNGVHASAHRFAYELENGPIPEGLVIDHICRNTACVRPSHLRAVTQRQNLLHGPTIIAAALSKVECHKGHPLSGDNLRINNRGWRVCRTCEEARWRRREAKKKGRASECPVCGVARVDLRQHVGRMHAGGAA